MAATLGAPASVDSGLVHMSFPIEKTETTADGDLIVYGKATDGSVDSDEQIVDPTFSGKAIQEWLATGGNVRVQHNAQRDPAGVGIEANTGPDGETWVKSLVVEPGAKTLVKAGALRAYSVGIARPKIVRDNVARGGRIVDGIIVEISLVDRPANKNCGIQLVKSASDGTPELSGKVTFHESLVESKSAGLIDMDELARRVVEKNAQTTITKTVGKTGNAFSPADLAKLLEHREAAEKRQMDPNVGGGVDRDKIPAADFAGRDRSFPIVTPGDVSDAASSIGRAGSSNYSSDELRRRITSIARRKGPSFVSELPESWKADLAMELIAKGDVSPDDDMDEADEGDAPEKPAKKAGKPAFSGAAKPFGSKDGEDDEKDGDAKDAKKAFDDSEDEHVPKDDEAKPDTTKSGGKTCPGCKAGYDADSKLRRCTECNRKLPMAPKSGKAEVEKKAKVMCAGCGANVDAKHSFCPECGKSLSGAKPSTMKNHKFTCLTCGNEPLDKGEKFCPKCGTQNPGYLPMADAQLKIEKGKPVPGAGVVGAGASDIEPVPAHREPDGEAIEEFEHSAGLPTVPDASVKTVDSAEFEAVRAEAFKSIGVAYEVGALHDALCSAFCPGDVVKTHPSYRLENLDVNVWAQEALKAAATAPLEEAGKATQIWQHAETIKSSEPGMISDIRQELHKEYTDGAKGPGSFPTPTEINPTSYRRGLLTGDHAAPSPGHDGPNTHAVPTSHICADDFTRGPLTAGQAADSPSNKGQDIVAAPSVPGEPTRVYYTTGMRDKAKSAMAAMHDHIAQTFPDLCPNVNNVNHDGAASSRPVPVPVHGALKSETVEVEVKAAEPVATDTTMAEAAKAAKKALKSLNQARKSLGLAPFTTDVLVDGQSLDAAVQKAAAVPQVQKDETLTMLTGLQQQLDAICKRLDDQNTVTTKLQADVEQLGNLPDPAVAAWKGAAVTSNPSTDNIHKTAGLPVGAATVAEAAERQKLAMISALQMQIRNSSDPAEREACWNQLVKMTGYAV